MKSSPKLPVFDRAVNRKAKQISAYISRPPALRDWVVPIWMSSWSARGQIRQDIQALNTEWLNQETLAAICSFALLYVVYLYVFRRYVVLCVVFVSLFVCFFLISLAWLVEWPLGCQCQSLLWSKLKYKCLSHMLLSHLQAAERSWEHNSDIVHKLSFVWSNFFWPSDEFMSNINSLFALFLASTNSRVRCLAL